MKITIENEQNICSISFDLENDDIGDMLHAALLGAGFDQQTIFDTFYNMASYMHDYHNDFLVEKYRDKSLGI